MKQSKFYPAIVLSTICIIVALLLSVVNMLTAPIIEKNQEAQANAALAEVLPEGKNFVEIDITDDYPATVTKGYKADAGFVFQMTVTGKSPNLIIMCGIDTEGKVVGTKVISSAETPSYTAKVFPDVEGTDGSKYNGMDLDTFAPYLVSGATLTSNAYGDAIKTALQATAIALGGEVDIRDPEAILQDNCNTALGTTDKVFTRWFATEVLEGIDKVYECDAGRVYLVGESFIGIKADGSVVSSEASATDVAKASNADSTIKASALTEIENLPDGLNEAVTRVYVTESGNYVFELSAKGYDVKFEYSEGHMPGNTPKPIIIKLSISSDGKIIDCETVSHGETAGVGDVCASEEYRDSWQGATDDDVTVIQGVPSHNSDLVPEGSTDLGAISGATYTTRGYQEAVKSAFEVFEILTTQGGND